MEKVWYSHSRANKILVIHLCLSFLKITNAFISCYILETSTQNWTKLLHFIKFLLVTNILRECGVQIFVCLYSKFRFFFTNPKVIMIRFQPSSVFISKFGGAYFLSFSNFQILVFKNNLFFDQKMFVNSCFDI